MFLDSVAAKSLTHGSRAKSLTSNDISHSPSSEFVMIGIIIKRLPFREYNHIICPIKDLCSVAHIPKPSNTDHQHYHYSMSVGSFHMFSLPSFTVLGVTHISFRTYEHGSKLQSLRFKGFVIPNASMSFLSYVGSPVKLDLCPSSPLTKVSI